MPFLRSLSLGLATLKCGDLIINNGAAEYHYSKGYLLAQNGIHSWKEFVIGAEIAFKDAGVSFIHWKEHLGFVIDL